MFVVVMVMFWRNRRCRRRRGIIIGHRHGAILAVAALDVGKIASRIVAIIPEPRRGNCRVESGIDPCAGKCRDHESERGGGNGRRFCQRAGESGHERLVPGKSELRRERECQPAGENGKLPSRSNHRLGTGVDYAAIGPVDFRRSPASPIMPTRAEPNMPTVPGSGTGDIAPDTEAVPKGEPSGV